MLSYNNLTLYQNSDHLHTGMNTVTSRPVCYIARIQTILRVKFNYFSVINLVVS